MCSDLFHSLVDNAPVWVFGCVTDVPQYKCVLCFEILTKSHSTLPPLHSLPKPLQREDTHVSFAPYWPNKYCLMCPETLRAPIDESSWKPYSFTPSIEQFWGLIVSLLMMAPTYILYLFLVGAFLYFLAKL